MNLGRRQDSASARFTTPRAILVLLLVACAAMALAAPDAMPTAAASTDSNPAKPLWREYPLERTATAQAAGSPRSSTESNDRASEEPAPHSGRRTSWIVFLLTGVAVALTVATAVVLRRNSAADRSPPGLFDERRTRAAAAPASGAALPAKNLAGRKPRRDRQRGAVVPEGGAREGERRPADATRRRRAPAETPPRPTRSAEAPDSGTERSAAAPPVAPSATEHGADTANQIPPARNAVPGPPEESAAGATPVAAAPEAVPVTPAQSAAVPEATREAPQGLPAPQHGVEADAESAATATPARRAGSDPKRKGSRAAAAPRAPSRQGSGASRSAAPPPRPATSDDAATRTTPGKSRPRRNSAAAPQGARADSAAVERDKSRTGAAVRGPICQVRWGLTGRGSCFSAVTTDASGVERTVATSPPVEWDRATPPEQSPEAQAALRQLAKTLRDKGWRPMRAKGKDFGELQWYARRFRHAEAPARDDSPVRSERGGSAP